jgi:Ctr copper transporter family
VFLVPESAILQTVPTTQTFGDMKKNMAWNQRKKKTNEERTTQDETTETPFVSIGCGVEPEDWDGRSSSSMDHRHQQRRRLQHAVEPSACNNVTNFFCWMDCLDIPNHEQAAGYVTEGYSLYCLDPTILARTGNQVSKAMEPCDGQTHNSNCLGSWQPTVPGIAGASVQLVDRNGSGGDGHDDDEEQPYCYGGTSMYMDGFHWTHPICVIYLFPNWALTSRVKFTMAAIGTLLFGILLEAVILNRRTVMNSLTMKKKQAVGPNQRLLVSATYYGAQLTMGYMIMLVVMTYSGVLFFCSVLGLVCGHVIFNAKDALWFRYKNKSKTNNSPHHTTAQATADTSYQQVGVLKEEDGVEAPLQDMSNRSSTESSPTRICCALGAEEEYKSKDDEEENDVPEGSTPCCQYTL